VRERCHALASWVRGALLELSGLPAIAPDTAGWYAQMVAVPLPPLDPPTLHDRLRRDHNVEIPVNNWGGRPHIRVSVQGYVTRSNLETLVRVLPPLIAELRTG
jgi:isopenicillin-N epimerase